MGYPAFASWLWSPAPDAVTVTAIRFRPARFAASMRETSPQSAPRRGAVGGAAGVSSTRRGQRLALMALRKCRAGGARDRGHAGRHQRQRQRRLPRRRAVRCLRITPIEELDGWVAKRVGRPLLLPFLARGCSRMPPAPAAEQRPRLVAAAHSQPISRRNLGLRRRQRLRGGSVDSARAERALSCT